MSTTSMAIFSNPLFATYSVYVRNASIGLCGFSDRQVIQTTCVTVLTRCAYVATVSYWLH